MPRGTIQFRPDRVSAKIDKWSEPQSTPATLRNIKVLADPANAVTLAPVNECPAWLKLPEGPVHPDEIFVLDFCAESLAEGRYYAKIIATAEGCEPTWLPVELVVIEHGRRTFGR